MKRIVLRIGGMSCSACSGGLEKYLNKQKGISIANVNLVMASASIEYDESIIDYDDIAGYISESGFECIGEYSKTEDKDIGSSKKLFIVYTVLAILLLYTAMGHMIGIPVPSILNMHTHPIWVYGISFILSVPFLFYGFDIIRSGIKNIIHLSPNMDSLVTVGVFSALIYSITVSLLYITGKTDTPPEVYFESVAIVIYFVKLGRIIDKKSKSKTRNAISSLVQLTPTYAYIKSSEGEKRVPLDEVKEGDILVCHPGERIAVDGEILSGHAHIDESFITGESKPVLKKQGDTVLAGSVNSNGYVEYLAKRVGKNSTVSEIVRLVLESSSTKAPIARVADRICLFFVPAVTGIALVSFAVHLILGLGISSAVGALITVLVVACPCALGLATPLATVISEGELAKDGILIKKSEILESASRIDTLVLDKTGTLTYGRMKISAKHLHACKENEIMPLVCGAEAKSSHPISGAFSEYAEENGIILEEVDDFTVLEGYGIYAKGKNEDIYLVNERYLCENGIANPFGNKATVLADRGCSIVYAVIGGNVKALFGISDIVREGTKEELITFKAESIECIMLTGDNEHTARAIANELGIERVIPGAVPSGKADIVKSLKSEGKICAMVGDGINDAIALSSADISISMHGATDIAMDCSDVILTHPSIKGISTLVSTSRRTLRIIKQNLFFAFLYNSLMIPIAAGALLPLGISITPMIASLAMVMSSICVSLNSLRLTKRRNKNDIQKN
ncbi:MAG: copper-translocating P-type ATPase [Clostridia bacterium]|nr:copper-translocating P-type ATPase [Clostridia bacterium]